MQKTKRMYWGRKKKKGAKKGRLGDEKLLKFPFYKKVKEGDKDSKEPPTTAQHEWSTAGIILCWSILISNIYFWRCFQKNIHFLEMTLS